MNNTEDKKKDISSLIDEIEELSNKDFQNLSDKTAVLIDEILNEIIKISETNNFKPKYNNMNFMY